MQAARETCWESSKSNRCKGEVRGVLSPAWYVRADELDEFMSTRPAINQVPALPRIFSGASFWEYVHRQFYETDFQRIGLRGRDF